MQVASRFPRRARCAGSERKTEKNDATDGFRFFFRVRFGSSLQHGVRYVAFRLSSGGERGTKVRDTSSWVSFAARARASRTSVCFSPASPEKTQTRVASSRRSPIAVEIKITSPRPGVSARLDADVLALARGDVQVVRETRLVRSLFGGLQHGHVAVGGKVRLRLRLGRLGRFLC